MNILFQHLLEHILQLWRRLLSLLRRGRYEREMEFAKLAEILQIQIMTGVDPQSRRLRSFRSNGVLFKHHVEIVTSKRLGVRLSV
jgi:hypothetical protein